MSVQERGRKDQTVRSRNDDLSLKTWPPLTWEQPIIYVMDPLVDPNQSKFNFQQATKAEMIEPESLCCHLYANA